MDRVRRYIHEQLSALLTDEESGTDIVDELEKEIFLVSKNNAIKNGLLLTDLINDPDSVNSLFLDSYMQTYIKVRESLERAIDSETQEIDEKWILSIPGASRETLNAQKWSTMLIDRTSETQIHKKKGIHRCPKCKSWFTSYQQLQTASADESMRVSVVCLDCNWHWKYS